MRTKWIYRLCLSAASLLLTALPVAADVNNPLTGTYYGTVTITSPATLGTIDLAFYLDVTGSIIQHNTSYIVREKTLVFPTVAPQVDGKDVGPRVTGTVSSSTFSLAVDRFESLLAQKAVYGGPNNTQKDLVVFRDVRLENATVNGAGNSVTGDYVEVLTGLDKNPITVRGLFLLMKPSSYQQPVLTDLNGDSCIDYDEIKSSGRDAYLLGYGEVGSAYDLYKNPRQDLKICSTGGDTGAAVIKQMFDEYRGTLK